MIFAWSLTIMDLKIKISAIGWIESRTKFQNTPIFIFRVMVILVSFFWKNQFSWIFFFSQKNQFFFSDRGHFWGGVCMSVIRTQPNIVSAAVGSCYFFCSRRYYFTYFIFFSCNKLLHCFNWDQTESIEFACYLAAFTNSSLSTGTKCW